MDYLKGEKFYKEMGSLLSKQDTVENHIKTIKKLEKKLLKKSQEKKQKKKKQPVVVY